MSSPSPAASGPIFETPEVRRRSLTPGLLIGGMLRAWRLGLVIGLAFVVLGVAYAAIRRPMYDAAAVIEPPISPGAQPGGASQVLASFAGIEAGGGNAAQFTKFLQVIGSIRFAARMEHEHHLLETLMPGWNPQTRTWRRPTGLMNGIGNALNRLMGAPAWHPPGIPELAAQLKHDISITLVPGKSPLELRSQVFTVAVHDTNPVRAYELLNWSLTAADEIVRQDQLGRTVNRIAYLKREIDATPEVYLRQSMQALLMQQEEMLMTLQADKFYAVDMIDMPSIPDRPVGTPGSRIVMFAILLGIVVHCVAVGVMLLKRLGNPAQPGGDPLRAPFPDPVGSAVGRLRAAFA